MQSDVSPNLLLLLLVTISFQTNKPSHPFSLLLSYLLCTPFLPLPSVPNPQSSATTPTPFLLTTLSCPTRPFQPPNLTQPHLTCSSFCSSYPLKPPSPPSLPALQPSSPPSLYPSDISPTLHILLSTLFIPIQHSLPLAFCCLILSDDHHPIHFDQTSFFVCFYYYNYA